MSDKILTLSFLSDHFSFAPLQTGTMLIDMLGLSIHTSPTKWQLPIAMLILLLVIGWYIINIQRASAKNHVTSANEFELSDATQGELNLLTYNVAGLPQIISSATLPRAKSIRTIGYLVSDFDIVNVQEDFNYNNSLYGYNRHPFRTPTKGKVPFGDGLNTLSKYPILESQRISWNNCAGSDCLTPKGFAHLRIQIAKEVTLDIYNLHATSQVNDRAVNARCQNMRQLAAYIEKYSKDRPVLIMGDFNAHYAFEGDDMHGFKDLTGAVDPWVDLYAEGIIPRPSSDFMIPKKLELTDEVESIDKILYRNGSNITFKPQRYRIEHELFVDKAGKHLSDHLAVSLRLEWEKK